MKYSIDGRPANFVPLDFWAFASIFLITKSHLGRPAVRRDSTRESDLVRIECSGKMQVSYGVKCSMLAEYRVSPA